MFCKSCCSKHQHLSFSGLIYIINNNSGISSVLQFLSPFFLFVSQMGNISFIRWHYWQFLYNKDRYYIAGLNRCYCKKQTKNFFLSVPMRNYSCCLMKIVWCNNPLIYLDTESIWINIQLGSTFILEIMSLTLLIWFINFIIAYQWGSVIISIRKFHLNIGRFLGNHLEKEHPIL